MGCDRAASGLVLIKQQQQGYSLMYSGPPCSGWVQHMCKSRVPYLLVWGPDGPLSTVTVGTWQTGWRPCGPFPGSPLGPPARLPTGLGKKDRLAAVNSAVCSPGCPRLLVQGLGRLLMQPPVPAHNRVRTVTESGSLRKLQPGCDRCLELGAIGSNLRPWGKSWSMSHHTS